MKLSKTLSALTLAALTLAGCKHSTTKSEVLTAITDSTQMAPCGELRVPASIEMGVFEGDSLKKQTELTYWNVGNDTLYISSILPECDCTEILAFDGKVAPGSKGRVRVALDLTAYPCDTIRKDIGILSSDRHDRVKHITLIGLRK